MVILMDKVRDIHCRNFGTLWKLKKFKKDMIIKDTRDTQYNRLY
jgi:hypothetical protein